MRNIRRLNSQKEVCELLARTPHPRTGKAMLGTYRELACFAALVGFQHQRTIAIDGPADLLVDGRILEREEQAVDLVYLLGVAATKSTDVLRDDADNAEKLATIFEQHVAGGLAVLADWLAADPADAHGDRAVLAALGSGGFLDDERPAAEAIVSVVF